LSLLFYFYPRLYLSEEHINYPPATGGKRASSSPSFNGCFAVLCSPFTIFSNGNFSGSFSRVTASSIVALSGRQTSCSDGPNCLSDAKSLIFTFIELIITDFSVGLFIVRLGCMKRRHLFCFSAGIVALSRTHRIRENLTSTLINDSDY